MRSGAEHPTTNHAGRGVLFLLGGVALGAAVGLLTAPRSGERTRRRIVRRAEDAKVQVAELYDDVADTVAGLRRGVTARLAGGKKHLDKTRHAILASLSDVQNPLGRLIHTFRG